MADRIAPTPRNKLTGLLADFLGGAYDYAQRPDPTMPMGKANAVLGLLADALPLRAGASVLDDLSYGQAPTRGTGMTTRLTPEATELALNALPFPKTSGKAALAALGAVDAGAMGLGKAVIPAVSQDVAEALARQTRMEAMGLERGWYRGGPEITDSKRSGPWYTQDINEAKGYAKRSANGETREYAIPSGGFLEAGGRYKPKLAHDVAAIVDDPYYGKKGAFLAKELRTFGPNEGITGGQLWQSLEAQFQADGAAEVMQKLGAFKGVKGITRGDEAYVFKNHPVRDAENAAFDPSKYGVDDIYGRTTLPMMGLLGGTSLGALYLSRKQRQDQEP